MEKEMATHSSILAWKSPWTEEPGRLQSMGLHDWACVHDGGGRWVGSVKLVELKKKKKSELLNEFTVFQDTRPACKNQFYFFMQVTENRKIHVQ